MYPAISQQQLALVYQWLVNGTKSCRESGELWYYRALAAERLNDKADAAYAMGKADNKLKASGFNPFTIQNHAAPSGVRRIRQKWALAVGIARFQHTTKELSLQFSDKDAQDFRDFLVNDAGFREDHVTLLDNEKATTRNIREAFGRIRQQAQADDLVVIYFSSHGWPRAEDPTGLSYVLTSDTETGDQAQVYATALQMVELAELGRWVKAQHYVLFLDTCFSGAAETVPANIVPTGAQGLESFTAALQGLQGSGNRVVIAASRANERSWEDPKAENGYFTRILLEALEQNPKDMSIQAVYDYLRDRVANEVERNQHQPQHPLMQSFGNGAQIVLGLPESAALTAPIRPRLKSLADLLFLRISLASPGPLPRW
jgi:hypothetical protein